MKPTVTFLFLLLINSSYAQEISVNFEEYEPKSTLVVDKHEITRAKFPFIDIHNHQWNLHEDKSNLKNLIVDMNKINMGTMVNLSGRGFSSDEKKSTTTLTGQIQNIKEEFPNRFVVFTNIDFNNLGKENWIQNAVQTLEDDVLKRGAMGLKIYKSLGFRVKDTNGKLVSVDDSRLDPIWKKAGELGIPVLIHSADPASFWDPLDRFNERWLELKLHKDRKKDASSGDFSWQQLIEQQHNVFRKNPKTTFINAHMGWFPNNLGKLDSLMQVFPNMYVEIGAVIAEIGRQPKTSNKFFTKWQDRILFGKDSWKPDEYATYFRVLETEDEYFPYHKKYHAFWKMYGIGLSDAVLKKVYYKNALKILPKLDKSQFPD